MDDQVGLQHFFQRGAKGGNQLGRQIRYKAHRVGKNGLAPLPQSNLAHGRVQRGEQHVLGQHFGAAQGIEQRGFARIGIAHQGNHRIRHALARRAVQPPGAAHIVQGLAQARYALPQQAPVGFQLTFPRPGKKAFAAPLTLKVGPGSDQARTLIGHKRQFHLQTAFLGPGTQAKNFENKAGAVNNLYIQRLFQIALLHRGQTGINNQQPGIVFAKFDPQIIDQPLAQKGTGMGLANGDQTGRGDVQLQCQSQTFGLFKAHIGIPRTTFGHRPFVHGDNYNGVLLGTGRCVHAPSSPLSSSSDSKRETGADGIMVEMACL